ncbi:hypothetical protein DH2020_012968 [Rehmannia glutinosa]|uniref:DUF4228 domain-containing protein n=1 Tax=Rehmannia glutinosa TaxID=99300 RepID=A0ABR0V0E2_REHGL
MGNCQAIDNASLVIQHPNGKIDKLYSPVSATEIMKMNPGHYVALLLTTTLYSAKDGAPANNNTPLRITRIKLLRPNDTLVLGHVYRLVTNQEVMKGLWAKKQAKLQQQHKSKTEKNGNMTEKQTSDFEAQLRKTDVKKTSQVKQERQRSRNNTAVNSGASKSKSWQPALKSISEAGS